VQAPAAAKVAPQATANAVSAEMPKVTSFELPLNDLAQVAQGSGLSWVNSDPAKIAAVQAAIAAEPKPVRVIRERPPVAASTEGPLVLVETKRDLRNMSLPFEDKSGS
jgi:ribonuclease E